MSRIVSLASDLNSSWPRLFFQFVIVFLGVYGAFWVEGYREDLDKAERAKQVTIALQQDLRDFVQVSSGFNTQMRIGLDAWAASHNREETPPPFVFRVFGAETPPMTTWEVVTQSELANLLDPALLYELGFFYNESLGTGKRYVRYAIRAEEIVLPAMELEPIEQVRIFYKEDLSDLKPEFAANMRRLSEYYDMSTVLVEWASCLEKALSLPDATAPDCRGTMGITSMAPGNSHD